MDKPMTVSQLIIDLEYHNFIVNEHYIIEDPKTKEKELKIRGFFQFHGEVIKNLKWELLSQEPFVYLFLVHDTRKGAELNNEFILGIKVELLDRVLVNSYARFPYPEPATTETINKWKEKMVESQKTIYLLRKCLLKTYSTRDPVTIENVMPHHAPTMMIVNYFSEGRIQVMSRNPKCILLNYVTFYKKVPLKYTIKELVLPVRVRNIELTINES